MAKCESDADDQIMICRHARRRARQQRDAALAVTGVLWGGEGGLHSVRVMIRVCCCIYYCTVHTLRFLDPLHKISVNHQRTAVHCQGHGPAVTVCLAPPSPRPLHLSINNFPPPPPPSFTALALNKLFPSSSSSFSSSAPVNKLSSSSSSLRFTPLTTHVLLSASRPQTRGHCIGCSSTIAGRY